MPNIALDAAELAAFGALWRAGDEKLTKKQGMDLSKVFDTAMGRALATMLGGIDIVTPKKGTLMPAQADCVEVGPVRIVGGVRPQDFDVGYRPDGVRFAFDGKTLNSTESNGKNWRNMVNDLAAEATTVHSRYPYAVVAFLFAAPAPSFDGAERLALIETLERLARRTGVDGPVYMAEAISLVFWNPVDGSIDPVIPNPDSTLRIERFSAQIEPIYVNRYKGLPPHDKD